MARLKALVVGWKRQARLYYCRAFFFCVREVANKHVGICMLEVIGGKLPLCFEEDIAIARAGAVKVELVDILHALNIHREPLKPVCEFHRYGIAIDAADLLKIGELADFHAVTPYFPSKTCRTERRTFPIVLDKSDVVLQWVDTKRLQTVEIEILAVLWDGLSMT